MKKTISVFLAILMTILIFPVGSINATDAVEITPPQFKKENNIYALGLKTSKEAWQCWESYDNGLYSKPGVKYFFLPENTDANNLTVYNSYNEDVTMNGVTIKANSCGEVPYTKGVEAQAICGEKSYKYIVLTSDSDASIYVNDTKNDYTNDNGTHFTDFYEFLIDNKQNSVKDSDVAVVTNDGLTETKLKKFKGRGNTNWNKSDKKQFNLTFYDNIEINGLKTKKISLINNERDGAVVRSKIVFDVANKVGLPYSSDTRYIDLYINGSYRGFFQASQKVEMGKNSLISLKDTSEDEGVTENFNFAVEVDIWNAGNDTHFKSTIGRQTIALNTPELEDYNENDEVQRAQMNFIKTKYNAFEDALYNGNMAKLEEICDIKLLAKAYLIQEWTKNCDGGLTSTYYTYNASTGKFEAAPVWDFDSGLGNVDCVRGGASTSTVYPQDWLTKNVANDGFGSKRVNTLGQAFYLSGTTSEGKTFLHYVQETWENDFIPAIKIAMGQKAPTDSRLKSYIDYVKENESAIYNNYVRWGFAWAPEKGMGVTYPYTYQGQLDYMRDWTIARTNWLTNRFLGSKGELLKEEELPTGPITPSVEDNAKFYLMGTLAGGEADWNRTDYPLTLNENKTKATIDLTLQKGLKYRFKVVKTIDGQKAGYYVANYREGVTGDYFYEDTSTTNLNVMAKHTRTVELTLVFDTIKNTFVAYHKGQVPPETTKPTESIKPTDPTESQPPTTPPTNATEPSETVPDKPEIKARKTSLNAGKTTTVKIINGKVLKWYSSKSKVAKVSSDGKVTALGKGTTKITAKLTTGEKLSIKIKVKNSPKLKKNGKEIKKIVLKKGKSTKISISGKATIYKNKYKNSKVAKIITKNKNAKKITIKATKKGTGKIYITVNKYYKKAIKIIVK